MSELYQTSLSLLKIKKAKNFLLTKLKINNFDILEKFLGLVPMQSTTIGMYILKAKVLCTNIKFLKVQIFSFIFSITLN